MPFSRPSLSRIKSRVLSDIESILQNGAAFLRRTFENTIGIAVAGVSHTLHGHIKWVSLQVLPTTAEDEFLVEHAETWMGPDARRSAVRAEFDVTASSTIDDITIDAGTPYTRVDGISYITTDTVIYSDTAPYDVTLRLRAVDSGDAGNCIPGTVLTITTPIIGLSSTAVVNGSGSTAIGGGADIEDIETLRTRLVNYIQSPPKGGATGDYITWAKEIDDVRVTRAWELPHQLGPGTVALGFVIDTFDDDGFFIDTTLPDAEQIETVQDYLNERIPISANSSATAESGHIDYVFAPTFYNLNPTIQLEPNTPSVRAAVQRSLQDLVLREAKLSRVESERTLPISRINEAISIAAGENDHILVLPASDVVPTATQLIVVGTITFQDIP